MTKIKATEVKTQTKVGPHIYDITFVPHKIEMEDGGLAVGTCNSFEFEIAIYIKRKIPALIEAFLHEHIHAIATEKLLPLSEEQVDQLGVGLAGLLLDNQHIFGSVFIDYFQGIKDSSEKK